jgi:drug/metabolite transporter (DMT)-like permease
MPRFEALSQAKKERKNRLSQNSRFGAYLALISAVLFWGLSFVATKVALESFSTFTLIFGRFSLAACVFLVLMAGHGFPRFTRKEHLIVVLVAVFDPGLYFVFETIGLQHTTAPKAALIIATTPIVVLVLSAVLLGERTHLASLFGMVTSVAGIGLLVTGAQDFRWALGGQLVGDFLVFGAVISAALYIVAARELGRRHSALEITSMQVIYGALLYGPAFLWELPRAQWYQISWASVGALGFLTLFATIGAFLCYNHALTKIPATRAAVFLNGIPVVTALGAWVVLDETLTLMQLGGGLLVLTGVFLANFPAVRTVPKGLASSLS